MITIYYLLDKREAYKKSKAVPIIADVKYNHNGNREGFRFSTGITCNPRNFIKQSIHGREPNSDSKNTYLQRMTDAAQRIYLNGTAKGVLPGKDAFKTKIKAILTEAGTEKTTLDYLCDYIDHLKAKGKSHHTTLGMERLKVILQDMQGKVSIAFEHIDLKFETAMLRELQGKGYNINTVGTYIKRLKMFLNWCVKNNLHRNMIYKQFEIKIEDREIIALTELEVEAVAKLDIPKHKFIEKGMKLSRDWFVIATQTGLRFSDWHKIGEAEIIQADGGFDIKITTRKTGAKVVIPVSRLLYRILKEYDFSPPAPPSNQKFNKNLKEIVKKAKIKKPISSHSGRKTFCTIQYRKGVPVPWIMKISGHRTEKEFYKYIGVDGTENAALVREKNAEFQISHMSA